MSIKKIKKGGVVILEVDNDLIGHQARVFQEFCEELTAEGVKQLVLNLQDVNSIDSMGVSVICRMIEKGRDVRLINLSHGVALFLKRHAFHLLAHRCSNEQEAIRLIHQQKVACREVGWIEKREFQRMNIQFPVFIKSIKTTASDEEIEGVTVNLSGGGVLLSPQTDYSLAPLSKGFSLRLQVPGSPTSLCAQGQLTRSAPEGVGDKWLMGIQFTHIEEADRDKIVDYVYNRENNV